MPLLLHDFRSVFPAQVRAQGKTLEWLAAAHTQAEVTLARNENRSFDADHFLETMTRHLARFGCGEDKIASRGYQLQDCDHTRWSEMQIYRLLEHPRGNGALERTRVFTEAAEGMLTRLYAEHALPPSELLHVTCTGYASPSAAQRMVAKKGWGGDTRVTHVYHMGCYAAFPALRIAEGLVGSTKRGRRCEIAHTEMCSLHLDPLAHTPEQLVVQTLFADGFIAYGMSDDSAWERRSAAFELLSQGEQLIPESSEAMTWVCSDWGMQMTLARDVPERLANALGPFVSALLARAGLNAADRRRASFAVHPGGPKILDRAQAVLELEDAQLSRSRKILRERGNMSSATLPHIWMEMAQDPALGAGALIVSLAFGPGLTLCGAVLRKVTP